MAAELAAVRRDLAETSAALASQKASNRGLQIRVAELLKGSSDMAALREACTQLQQEQDALLASKHLWTTNETRESAVRNSYCSHYVCRISDVGTICCERMPTSVLVPAEYLYNCITL